MSNPKTQDLIYESLFRKDDDLTPKQREQLTRYEAAFVFWLDKPWLREKKMVDFLTTGFGISVSQAYIDIKNLQNLFGRIRNASKEWFRHVANEMIADAVEILEDDKSGKLEISKAEQKIKAAKALVDINRLNKDDIDPIDWSKIIPQNWEPTDDPKVLGHKLSREEINKNIAELNNKYGGDIEVQDIDYEEVKREVDG